MTCQDCELLLAQGEVSRGIEEHLRECAECRALQEDLRTNALALESLQLEELPRVAVTVPRRKNMYAWAGAAAAAVLLAVLLVPRTRPMQTSPPEAPKAQQIEPMKIKMLTPDPTVVIYWLIDN